MATVQMEDSGTPDVAGQKFITVGTSYSNTSHTDFLNGVLGQELTILFRTSDVHTIVHNTSLINLNGGVNFVSSLRDQLTLLHDGSKWYEKARKV